jgi:hypothetical protein
MLQLVDDGVHIMHPYSYELLGKEHVFEKYGVLPSQICDLFALMGDAVVECLIWVSAYFISLLSFFLSLVMFHNRIIYQELQGSDQRQRKC